MQGNRSVQNVYTYEPGSEGQAQDAPNNLSTIYGSTEFDPAARQAPYEGAYQAGSNAHVMGPGAQNNQNQATFQNTYSPYGQTAVAPTRPQLPSVKVALLVPLSGRHKDLGEAMLNAAQMALFDIGHTNFELIPRDTQGTAQGAAKAAEDAVNNGAQLVLGPVFAQAVRRAKPVTSRANIPMIAFSTDWTLADNNTFMMGFMPFDQVRRILDYSSRQNLRNIGVLAPNSDYGDAVVTTYQNYAMQLGINTVKTRRFSPSGSDLSPVVERFSEWNSRNEGEIPPPYDAIFIPAGGEIALSLGNLASQYGMTPRQVRRLGTGLMDDRTLAREEALEGTWFAAPDPDLRRNFMEQYFTVYGASPPRLSTLAYDATALAAVLARTGLQNGGQPAFTAQSIMNPNGFIGIDGIFRFRSNGLVERGLAVLEFKNGLIRVVNPAPQTFENQSF